MADQKTIIRELRIMHACELGAVGVYRGHKCVARYVFRRAIKELDVMRSHERNHVNIFLQLLKDRKARPCIGYNAFFWGGLLYGVLVGLFGLRAIGESTKTIESIVLKELDDTLLTLSNDDVIANVIREVKSDELNHQNAGIGFVGESYALSKAISKIAKSGAYTAKYAASIL